MVSTNVSRRGDLSRRFEEAKGDDEAAIAELDAPVEERRRLSGSAPTVTEIVRGPGSDDREEFDAVGPAGRKTADRAATVLGRLDERGEPIGAVDAMVAATAPERDGIVVPRNGSELRRIDSLRVEPY